MAVHTQSVQVCDRCLRPFQEKHLKAGDEVPTLKQSGLIITKTTGTTRAPDGHTEKQVVKFDDLCPDCEKAVEGLIARLRLDGGDKRGKKVETKGNGKKKAPKVEEAPKVEPPPASSEPLVERGTSEAASTVEVEKQVPENAPKVLTDAEKAAAEKVGVESKPEVASSEATSGALPDNAVRDEATGDVYDTRTGEVLSRGPASNLPF